MIRFSLLASLLMIPAFLANIQQYRALQTGQTLAWVAAPQFVLVWLAAILSVMIPSRIVMAAGFATIGAACWLAAHVDSSWAGNSFLVPELVLSTGIATAFVGLVISLMMLALEMGAVRNAINAATFSGCMHTMRLLGGQIGAVLFARFLNVREQFHSNLLGQNVEAGNWLVTERLTSLGAAVAPNSGGAAEAQARGIALLNGQVRAQAYSLESSDAFLLLAWSIAAYLLLLTFLRRSTIDIRNAGKAV
jgi:DHA2 family multidrug resistance protein